MSKAPDSRTAEAEQERWPWLNRRGANGIQQLVWGYLGVSLAVGTSIANS